MVVRKKDEANKKSCMSAEQIAYELWQNRGCPHGDDWTDWLKAEKIVKANKR